MSGSDDGGDHDPAWARASRPRPGHRSGRGARRRRRVPRLCIVDQTPGTSLVSWSRRPLTSHCRPGSVRFGPTAQGRFTLGGLPRDADLTLQVRDDRFALQDFRIATGHEESAKETVLPLAPPHLLEGRVTFGDSGRPAAGARLHVVGYQSPSTDPIV